MGRRRARAVRVPHRQEEEPVEGLLAGKVAIITGAASGIGRAAVDVFTEQGARVVAADRNPAVHALARPGTVVPVEADVSRAAAVEGLVQAAERAFGGLDVLFSNAGIERLATVVDTTEELWHEVLDANLKSVFLCAKYAIPAMLRRGGGAIVNNASINGIRGNTRLAAYQASKGGVVALTYSIAMDYAARGIRCNAVCPGTIQTPMVGTRRPEELQAMIAKHPIGRIGRPEEVAWVACFLASDRASFLTGLAVPVCGGRDIR
jgi:NAD(P)-dependent dehydrogenase (short-subunit alcohol dehydrogenase family)